MESIIKLHQLEFEPYISASEIEQQIERLASEINCQYAGLSPLIVITLNGAFIFGAELVKRLNFQCEIAFVKCSSYHDGTQSSGAVEFELGLKIDPAGRDILILEDIVDSGTTYMALHRYFSERSVKSIRIATLCFKSEAYHHSTPLDYVALEVENIFIVGYGLDYNQLGRNINGIYKLKK